MAEAGKVLFHLTDDALIVANSGEQFTRNGVIAICHMHLSEKMKKPQDIFDKDLIRAIAERKVGKYNGNLNELISDAGVEEELGKDQHGRFVWELLQNADDAATRSEKNAPSEFIGAKGLGFRSILEISDSPEIYSGNFNFRFSREDSRRMLINNGVSVENDVPAFSIPHPCKPDRKCAAFLKGGYSTVIRLPFADDKVKEAEKQLGKLDASCLLFCQRLFRIEIEIRGESRIIELNRNGTFGFKQGKATFTLQENNEIRKWRRWSVAWSPENNTKKKQLSAALCLPMGENGETETDEERPVHVFFPTAEVCVPGLKALLHASYNLQGNREHFDKEQPHGEAIRDKIGDLASEILADIPPVAALHAFGKIPPTKNNANKTIEQLQNAFAVTVAQTPFVPVMGGAKVKPAEARIWGYGLGRILRAQHPHVREAKLLIPSLSAEPDVRGILAKLGAKPVALHEHGKLLQSCQSDTLNACYAAWQVAGNIACEVNKNTRSGYVEPARIQEANTTLAKLKEAPIWWTEANNSRPLNGDIPLLRERPREWPEWLKADALSPEFRKLLGGATKKAGAPPTPADSLRKSGVWPLDSEHSYFTDALLPFCKGKDSKWWEEMGWDVLRWAFLWGGGEVSKFPPSIIDSGDKGNWIDEGIIHLPTKKGWLSAIHCYAGKAWGGPANFGKYFLNRKVQNRGEVIPMEEWKMPPNTECDKKKWENFLRGLGVSWGPKVRRVSLNKLLEDSDDLVSEYMQQHLTKIRTIHRSASYITEGESTFVEHFPGALAGCPSAHVFRAVKSIEPLAKKTRGTFLKYRYQQIPDGTSTGESFASFQLRHSEWVPCRPGLLRSAETGKVLLVAPKDALMPDCGMGILPEIIRGECSNNEWHGSDGIEEMFKGLGVPAGLPDEPERFHKWMNMLAQYAAEKKLDIYAPDRRWDSERAGATSERGNIAHAVKLLFKAYFQQCSENPIPKNVNVPFLRKTPKGEFVYLRACLRNLSCR